MVKMIRTNINVAFVTRSRRCTFRDPPCFRACWNSCIVQGQRDNTSRIPRGRPTCRGARHYRNLIKLRDNICCRPSTTRRRGGSIPPRDSVIANSELPLRILKFRAPAAARYLRENAPCFCRAAMPLTLKHDVQGDALLTLTITFVLYNNTDLQARHVKVLIFLIIYH